MGEIIPLVSSLAGQMPELNAWRKQKIQHKAIIEQDTEFLCEQKSIVINKYANSSLMLCHETNSSQMLSEL